MLRVTLYFLLLGLSSTGHGRELIELPELNDFDAYESTMTVALLPSSQSGLKFSDHHTRIRSAKAAPDREAQKTYYRFFKSPKRRHNGELIFIFEGLGSYGNSPVVSQLALWLTDMGFDVLSLGSSMTDRFSYSVSRTGYPGIVSQDAKDRIYQMSTLLRRVARHQGRRYRSVQIVGYSYGALMGAHVQALYWKHRHQVKGFKLKQLVMINPPVDLHYGIKQLDGYYQSYPGFSWTRIADLAHKVFELWPQDLMQSRPVESSLKSVKDVLGFLTRSELKYSISYTLRGPLYKLAVASQRSHDLKLISRSSRLDWQPGAPVDSHRNGFSHWKTRFNYKDVQNLSYEDYAKNFVLAFYRKHWKMPQLSLADLNRLSSLQYTFDVAPKPSICLLHNQDDFLLKPGDVALLKSQYPRTTIFDRGGHIGNIWHKEFRKHFKACF